MQPGDRDLDELIAAVDKARFIELLRDPEVRTELREALGAVAPTNAIGTAHDDDPLVRGIKGAAACIGYSKKFCENARSTGSFPEPATKVGRDLWFRKTELRAWKESNPRIVVKPRNRKSKTPGSPVNGKSKSRAEVSP